MDEQAKTKAPERGDRRGVTLIKLLRMFSTYKSADSLVSMVSDNTESGDLVLTDEARSYLSLRKEGYSHLAVGHLTSQYVDDMAHTNGMKSKLVRCSDGKQLRYEGLIAGGVHARRRMEMTL